MGIKFFLKNGEVVIPLEKTKISGNDWDSLRLANNANPTFTCLWWGTPIDMGVSGDATLKYTFDNNWYIIVTYTLSNNTVDISLYNSTNKRIRGVYTSASPDTMFMIDCSNGYLGGLYNEGNWGCDITTFPTSYVTKTSIPTNEHPGLVKLNSDWLIPNSNYPNGGNYYLIATSVSPNLYTDPTYKEAFDGLYENKTEADPYGGTTSKAGGKGNQDDRTDPVAVPSLPNISAISTGFISLYVPTSTEVGNLAAYMWSNDFIDSFKKYFASPSEAIISFGLMPVSVESFVDNDVKICGISSGISMHRTAHQYVTFDCGTLDIEEYYAAYLDYSPYTKASLYCPFSGYHDISIDDVVGKSLSLKYNIDLLSGSFVALVSSGLSVLYSWGGNMLTSLPTSQSNFAQTYLALSNMAVSVGTTVASGGLTAPVTAMGVASMASNSLQQASNVMASKPTFEHGGGVSANSGMLGIKTPYLIIRRPKMAHPSDYRDFNGYPSNITSQLGDLEGFTQVERIHLDNIDCTDNEKNEIERLLMEGVIF